MSRNHYGLSCPDCGDRLTIRSSRQEGANSRQLFFQCVNVEGCGSAFGGQVEITHRTVLGVAPNPARMRTAAPRRVAANDTDPARTSGPEVPPAHNDDQAADLTAG